MADTLVDAAAQTTLYYRPVRIGPVYIDENTGYLFFVDSGVDLFYRKTTDGGANWEARVLIRTGTVVKLSICYDRWITGDSGTEIHVAYSDSTVDDIFYRSLDTSDDSLSAEVTVFAGASFGLGTWATAVVDIMKARGGNLYIGFWGDVGGEFGFYRSTDGGANWTSRAQLADGAEPDRILLMPGSEADNQDIWCIYWDVSANEISLKIYDDSGDSWSETLIATGMADSVDYYQMSASQRHSDNHVILAAWNALDTAISDLKVWDIGGSGSITAKVDVVTDLDEAAQVAVLINQQNDDIYVAYLKGGTWTGFVDVKYKKSTDGAGSWGAEQTYSEAAAGNLRAVWAGISVGDDGGKFQPVWFHDTLNDLFVNLVNDVSIAAVGVGETRDLAGSQPAATGVLAKVLTAFKSLTGDQPASTGTLVRIEQALRVLAGDQPTATGILTRVFGRPRSLTGDQPTPTGTLVGILTTARAIVGAQPAALGILTRIEKAFRALAGNQPSAVGTLDRRLDTGRALTGSQPSSTGVLARIEKAIRAVAGNQPNATGILTRVFGQPRSTVGNQPMATGILTRVEKALRALTGTQPASSGTLVRKEQALRGLVGDQPFATGTLTAVILGLNRSLAGAQPASAGTLGRMQQAGRVLVGTQPTALGVLSRTEQALRALVGVQPSAVGVLVPAYIALRPQLPVANARLADYVPGAAAFLDRGSGDTSD